VAGALIALGVATQVVVAATLAYRLTKPR